MAVIADSSWADERCSSRMGSVAVGPLQALVLPYEAALVDTARCKRGRNCWRSLHRPPDALDCGDGHLVAAPALRLVKRAVGESEEFVGIGGVLGQRRDAGGDGDPHMLRTD